MHAPVLHLYEARFGRRPEAIEEVAADGSQRRYWRLVGNDGSTLVGAFGPESEENRAFLAFSEAFRSIELPVPEIVAADEKAGVWLMEDLGDTTLFDALGAARAGSSGRFPSSIEAIYRRVVEILPRFQVDGHRVVDYDLAYPHTAFDRRSILWDLNYFKYHFLKLAHVPFHEARLERDFEALADFLLEAEIDSFLYRDFQSRNVMLVDGEPRFIDYQGGRRGARQYDLASLLYDAKADLPEEARGRLLGHYLDALAERTRFDRAGFLERWGGYVVVRIVQAMGAYGYRGFFERKPGFLRSVPYAAANIEGILDDGMPLELPEIETVFRRIVDRWAPEPDEDPFEGLTVRLTSFSYRHGYPGYETGHGGGFVFDCRALPNPGREDAYRGVSGRDREVVEWLEAVPELEAYWERTRELVGAQVETYLERGFSELSVAYGCTGGQHRSVYLAERLARWLEERFPGVRVVLTHRESPRWPADSDTGSGRPPRADAAAPAGAASDGPGS
ncbi:MAG: phosphotransferase [Gemmatimonadetes bacterium]|nr:phosphotransferase [Gemmatimonadota bacterium]